MVLCSVGYIFYIGKCFIARLVNHWLLELMVFEVGGDWIFALLSPSVDVILVVFVWLIVVVVSGIGRSSDMLPNLNTFIILLLFRVRC